MSRNINPDAQPEIPKITFYHLLLILEDYFIVRKRERRTVQFNSISFSASNLEF